MVYHCKGLGCVLQMFLYDVAACARVLDCNWSGSIGIALLCQLLATHVNGVSGLQLFALTQSIHVTPGLGATIKLVELTH